MSSTLLDRNREAVDHALPERLLPGAAIADLFGDVDPGWMDPAEAETVGRAVPERRREFGSVRHCARRALGRLGLPPQPILPDTDGAPRWPDGVVGSMTHCPGYRAAAVAWSDTFAGLGIDAEPHRELPGEALGEILRGAEWPQLQALTQQNPGLHWDRILFSAKESVYKTWFPLTRQWLDFGDVTVALHPGGWFRAALPAWGPRVSGVDLSGLNGRWLVDRGLIVTVAYTRGGVR